MLSKLWSVFYDLKEKLVSMTPLYLLSLESKQQHLERRKKDTLFIPSY